MKRKLMLAVVIGVTLLTALLAWWQIKPTRVSPADAIQIRLLGTNASGQLQFWATNTSRSRVHVAFRDVEVIRDQKWVTDQHLLSPGRQFALNPYTATQGVFTFSKSIPPETWRVRALTVEELDGAARLVEHAKLKLEDLKAGTTSNIPTTPAQGGPFFPMGHWIHTEAVTNGIGAATQ